MSKLVIGCGYLGLRVARRWLDKGDEVFALTRKESRTSELGRMGIKPVVGDVTQPETLNSLPEAHAVLFAVGFDRSAGYSIQKVYVDGLRNTLDALPETPHRFIYISSTGVYGQTRGEWVDEDSPCEPQREGGRACLAAERLLGEHAVGQNSIVLRLAGLYGPGRIPRRKQLAAGEPIDAASDGYLNLIHVADAAEVVIASQSQAAPRTYVVSDGCPVLRRDYFREMARLIGAPPPTFQEPAAESPAAMRAASTKRVNNRRMVNELGVNLRFPTYCEGLAYIVRDRGLE